MTGRQEIRLKYEATTTAAFLKWLKGSTYGEWCVYHRGSLSADRAGNPELCRLADTVLLLQDTGFVIATQHRRAIDDPTRYIATRTGTGYAPRAIMQGDITAGQWRILAAIRDARHGRSITRVIRDTLATSSDKAAAGVLDGLKAQGWVEEDPAVLGWKISRAGLSLLV